MTENEVTESFLTFFELEPGHVGRDVLLKDLPIDSLGVVEWLLQSEEDFDVQLNLESLGGDVDQDTVQLGVILDLILTAEPLDHSSVE